MVFDKFYEQFLTVLERKQKGFSSCKCPFCNSIKITSAVDLRTGTFNCFKCGTFSAEKFLSKINPSISLSEATYTVDEILQRENVKFSKDDQDLNNGFTLKWAYNRKIEELYGLCSEIDNSDLIDSYCSSRDISNKTIKSFGIKIIEASLTPEKWNRDSIVFPYFSNGKVVGLRYRDCYGNKYAQNGSYMLPWGVLESDPTNDTILILEGESDALRCHQAMIAEDMTVDVAGLPGARFPLQWVREFNQYTNIIFIPQGDLPAQKVIDDASKCFDKTRFTICEIPWKRGQIGKDLCDWFSYNSNSDLAKIVKSRIKTVEKIFYTGTELRELLSEESKETPLVDNILDTGQIVLIGGKQKAKKTWVLLELLRTLLNPGELFCGIPGLKSNGSTDRKILIIEEEGNRRKFVERLDKVFHGMGWENNITLAHKMGVKLDNPIWEERICSMIEKEGFNDIMLDPLQRLHSKEENDSTAMMEIYDAIHRIINKFPRINMYLIHHFGKTGEIRQGFDAFRGSSRTGGEGDLGIFIEGRPRSENDGIKMRFIGRDMEDFELEDGEDIVKLLWNKITCRLTYDGSNSRIQLAEDNCKMLFDFIDSLPSKKFKLTDAAIHFVKTPDTIKNWISKMDTCIMITKPSRGNPANIQITGEYKLNETKT